MLTSFNQMSSGGTTVIEAASSTSVPQVNPQELSKFLSHVAEGEQEQAEAMLKANRELVLVSGEVTDLSKRTFENITAFQYALWALDCPMWTMLLKYLPDESAREQAQNSTKGSWASQHGYQADWNNLIHSLQEIIQNWDTWNIFQINEHLVKQIGGAQLLLPAHVVNEYCHPTRSFGSTLDFSKVESNGTWRTRQTDAGEWFTCQYHGGKLGDKFAVLRGSSSKALACDKLYYTTHPSVGKLKTDLVAVSTLYETRLEQHAKLLTELLQVEKHSLKA